MELLKVFWIGGGAYLISFGLKTYDTSKIKENSRQILTNLPFLPSFDLLMV